jgi:hypothetical protein
VNTWAKLTVVCCCVVALPLEAQVAPAPNHLYDRLQFTVSGTQVWLGSKVRVDANDGSPGTEFDGGDVGAANRIWEPRVALRWRLGRRNEFEVGYLFARTSGSRVLGDTIRFADTAFARGMEVHSKLKSDQASLTYRYAFYAADRSQIGLAVGLGALFFDVALRNADTALVPISASANVVGPTGSLGLFGRWQVGDRWDIESDARALHGQIDRITATVYEAGAAARYFVSPHAGFELGYGLTWIKVDVDHRPNTRGFAGLLQYSLQNLRLGAVLTH